MYQVFCNSKSHRKLQPYSKECETIEETEQYKKIAEENISYDIYNNVIKYKIKEV